MVLRRFEIRWQNSEIRPTWCEAHAVAESEESLRKYLEGGEPTGASEAFKKMCPNAPKTTTPAIFFDEGTIEIEDVTEKWLGVEFPLVFNYRQSHEGPFG